MADTKISALTDGVTANATDRIPVGRSPFGSSDNAYITPDYIVTHAIGGSDMAVQFNDGGSFGGSDAFLWDDAAQSLLLGDPSVSQHVYIGGTSGTIANPVGTDFTLYGGDAADDGMGTSAPGGGFLLTAGQGVNGGKGGNIELTAGFNFGDANGANVNIVASDANDNLSTDFDGGRVNVTLGNATGTGTPGQLVVNNLPSSDPGIPGAVYQVAGALMISL